MKKRNNLFKGGFYFFTISQGSTISISNLKNIFYNAIKVFYGEV